MCYRLVLLSAFLLAACSTDPPEEPGVGPATEHGADQFDKSDQSDQLATPGATGAHSSVTRIPRRERRRNEALLTLADGGLIAIQDASATDAPWMIVMDDAGHIGPWGTHPISPTDGAVVMLPGMGPLLDGSTAKPISLQPTARAK